MKAKAVAIPKHDLLRKHPIRNDYADAYEIVGKGKHSARQAAEKIFDNPPRFVRILLRIRDAIVRPLGLETARDIEKTGNRVGIFPVVEESNDAILFAKDDKHLGFQVFLQNEETETASTIRVTTLVEFHGWTGRFYFFFVGPVHRILVPSMLNRSALAFRS